METINTADDVYALEKRMVELSVDMEESEAWRYRLQAIDSIIEKMEGMRASLNIFNPRILYLWPFATVSIWITKYYRWKIIRIGKKRGFCKNL